MRAPIRHASPAVLALSIAASLAFARDASAGPILFNTSGSFASAGPALGLAGVTDQPFNAPLPVPAPTDGRSSFSLGRITVDPLGPTSSPLLAKDAKPAHVLPPSFDRTTFSLRMSFNVPYLPALQFKGMLRSDAVGGVVTSVTSLDPGLNGNLNPTFAALLQSPSNVRLDLYPYGDRPGAYDVTATVLPAAVFGVPEPSSAAALIAGVALLGLARRRLARG